jgi:hypothetical protein
MNIDQAGLTPETPKQKLIADHYAYLELKKLGYSDTELFNQFQHVMSKNFERRL